MKSIEKDPQKNFSLLKPSKKGKIEYITKLVGKEIKILLGKEMIKEIENKWREIFSSKIPPQDLSEFLRHTPSIPSPSFTPNFSLENIQKIIKTKHNSAPGLTETSWKCLKRSPLTYLEGLSKIFTHLYNLNYIPLAWKNGITILIEKPTNDIGLDKYRPITLLAVEYKLFTHILNETLIKELATNNIIPLSQNGFFPNRGSEQCIHTFLNVIDEAKTNNRDLNCLFIDFEKAFDSVEHWAIKSIIDHLNLGKLGEVVYNSLLNSSTQIETVEGRTELIPFERGTKQGDIISPTIFIIFIAPLLWALKKSNLGFKFGSQIISNLTVADDILLLAELQKNIIKLFEIVKRFSDLTKINIKGKKSASAYRSANGFIPVVDGVPFQNLGKTNSYRYLGVWINLE